MKKVLLICLVCVQSQISAQENFGILHSNYATTNVVSINPANGVMSKSFLDVNLAGAKAFFNNDLVYLSKDDYKFSSVIKGNTDGITPLYNLAGNTSKGFVNGSIMGPALALSVGDNAFEIHANAKAFTNVNKFPNSLAQYIINQENPTTGTYEHSNIKGAALSYVEIGGSYSRNLIKRKNDILSAGINLNYLIGVGGAGAKINNANYTVNETDDITLNSLNGEYMYVEPQWNSGKGVGGGLGFTYTRMESSTQNYLHNTVSSDCNCEDYKFKLGASLIDIGFVNFKDNALYRNFTENSGTVEDLQNLTLTDLDATIANSTTAENQTVKNTGKIYLPGAASLQADYKVKENIYLGAAYIHGFSKGKNRFGVQRPKSLAITPRIEFKRVEFALPISLYEWQKPQIGAMLRINNNLIIGTDKLGALTGKTNVYGADIYVNLKFGIVRNPKCKDPRSTNSSSSRSNGGKANKYKTGKKSRGKENKYTCPSF